MVEIHQRATADIGSYFLTLYGGMKGKLLARNAVSALGAAAGVFAHLQARALLASGALQNTERSLVEVRAASGEAYYFGDAINACVLEGSEAAPAFWNYVAPIAGDREVAALIDVAEIARHTANTVGGEGFGVPRAPSPFAPTELPIEAARRHVPKLSRRFEELALPPQHLMLAFGAAAQGMAHFAAGEEPAVKVDMPVPRVVQAGLLMEAAIPMSKIDFAAVAPKPKG